MKERYVTITGMNHYYGMKPFSTGKKIRCMKERDNCFDDEAIKVVMHEIGTVGYIANSPHTTVTGTMSAGRIYDRVPNKFMIQVMFITGTNVICRVLEEKKSHCRYDGQARFNAETIVKDESQKE